MFSREKSRRRRSFNTFSLSFLETRAAWRKNSCSWAYCTNDKKERELKLPTDQKKLWWRESMKIEMKGCQGKGGGGDMPRGRPPRCDAGAGPGSALRSTCGVGWGKREGAMASGWGRSGSRPYLTWSCNQPPLLLCPKISCSALSLLPLLHLPSLFVSFLLFLLLLLLFVFFNRMCSSALLKQTRATR